MVKQALVDVADLLDVEGAEAESARLRGATARDSHLQVLQRLEQVQDSAVVDRQRLGGGRAPARSCGPSLQERKLIGVEEASAVCREGQPIVLHPAVDGTEGGQQAAPGVVAPLHNLFTYLVGCLPQLRMQGGDGVVLIVERIVQRQQPSLFSAEEKDQAHHHLDGGLVQLLLREARQECTAPILICQVDGLDQHLDGGTHLKAKLVCDFLLVGARSG